MASGWTPERRAAQRLAIRRWRPWEKSTGPKSPAGKVRVSKNATKHGRQRRSVVDEQRAIRKLLKDLRVHELAE